MLQFPNMWPHQVEAVAFLILHVLEAVLAKPELRLLAIIFREWREVPGIDLIVPNVDLVHVLHLGDLCRAVDSSVGAWEQEKLGGEGHAATGPPAYRLMLLLQGRSRGVHLCIGLGKERASTGVSTSGRQAVCPSQDPPSFPPSVV